MKKIGYQVSMLPTGEKNQRNSEGSFLRLKDGGILYVYSRFGAGGSDEAPSDIAYMVSYDEGETWSEPAILQEHDPASINYMCPSLLRMDNGDVGLIYLRKYADQTSDPENGVYPGNEMDMVMFTRSSDEGKTWSEPMCVTAGSEYIIIENDRVIRLQNGRILIPANHHSHIEDGRVVVDYRAKMFMIASDDDGRSWYWLSDTYEIPHPKSSRTGLQETVIYEQEDGRIRALSRTDRLCQYECYSEDGGKTWGEVYPNPFFSSPISPLSIKRACGYTVAIWNPIPNYTGRELKEWSGRTPCILAVSESDGASFDRMYYIENDPQFGCCYSAIFDGGAYMLVGYFIFGSSKIVKIRKEELSI